jgi:hypothetical protein
MPHFDIELEWHGPLHRMIANCALPSRILRMSGLVAGEVAGRMSLEINSYPLRLANKAYRSLETGFLTAHPGSGFNILHRPSGRDLHCIHSTCSDVAQPGGAAIPDPLKFPSPQIRCTR